MAALKIFLFSLTLLNSISAFSAQNDREAIIFSDTVSRQEMDSSGQISIIYSELYDQLLSGDECKRFDKSSKYESYRLETVILSPSSRNVAAFSSMFNGERTENKILSATHQICYGIRI